jgi:ppGpp synthetase/RelA/SpoT-type nucleotidyltranferase
VRNEHPVEATHRGEPSGKQRLEDIHLRHSEGAPPPRGWGLGLRLAVLVGITVTGVMAAISGVQLAADLRSELRERQLLLAASLSPLVSELQDMRDAGAARAVLDRFHGSYVGAGQVNHYIGVATSDGRVLLHAGKQGDGKEALTAAVPLMASALGPDRLQVLVRQEDERLSEDRARRWRAWAVHVGATAVVVLLLLFIVIRREVTQPIERLLKGIRKMELGYWDDVPDPGGAWEIRWLAWRFRTIGGELRHTVTRLLGAQRRAHATEAEARVCAGVIDQLRATEAGHRTDDVFDGVLRSLRTRLARLVAGDANDPEARRLAELTWNLDAREAERIGSPELRVRLEDAALRILQPEAFCDIERQLEARRLVLSRAGLELSSAIESTLTARGVPLLSIHHRIKHVAGVWRKMQDKNLSLDQVHDLLALRIVAPTVSDCYHALGVVHDLHEPLVDRFKDYIAQPKPNGYQALHTSVQCSRGFVFEVQIRSLAMHALAEHGEASHSTYKARNTPAADKPRRWPGMWKWLAGLGGR